MQGFDDGDRNIISANDTIRKVNIATARLNRAFRSTTLILSS
jgi:hypothetical protein